MWIKNGSTTMLATKSSAGFVQGTYLGNPLHTGDEACEQKIHPGFETQGRRQQKSKTGISVAPQKDWYPPNIFKN